MEATLTLRGATRKMEGATWERIAIGVLGVVGTAITGVLGWLLQRTQSRVAELTEERKASVAEKRDAAAENNNATRLANEHSKYMFDTLMLDMAALKSDNKELRKGIDACIEERTDNEVKFAKLEAAS